MSLMSSLDRDELEQSESAALRITRGARRLLATIGYSSVCELVLPNGRRADVAALSGTGKIMIVEVKSCAADFRADHKWQEYLDYCDELCFAVAPDGPIALIPESAGLIVADSYAGEFVRRPQATSIASARRRAMLLTLARHAADRLHRLQDPMARDHAS